MICLGYSFLVPIHLLFPLGLVFGIIIGWIIGYLEESKND